jgi:hypothetical protein
MAMRHVVADISDLPDGPQLVDRRRTPDRRTVWRGGRRDSDWVNRPPGVLTELEAKGRTLAAFRKAVSSVLHLW